MIKILITIHLHNDIFIYYDIFNWSMVEKHSRFGENHSKRDEKHAKLKKLNF
jgi:hypothetical protein